MNILSIREQLHVLLQDPQARRSTIALMIVEALRQELVTAANDAGLWLDADEEMRLRNLAAVLPRWEGRT